jgi:hypothetical protein
MATLQSYTNLETGETCMKYEVDARVSPKWILTSRVSYGQTFPGKDKKNGSNGGGKDK